MATAKRRRLDEVLLDRGLSADLRAAQALVMTGNVLVEGAPCAKPGTLVRHDAAIVVKGAPLRYASRGGFKLEAALRRFGVAAEGRVVLDAGASTGGFTDCLLQHGAAKVYAVDVGYGQIRGRLAADPRVVVMERTNIGDLTRASFPVPIDLCTFDLSYLSCTKAAPHLASLFDAAPVEIIGLVKPLFEGIPAEQMADVDGLRPALVSVVDALAASGLGVTQLVVSPIKGGRGSVEFLAHIRGGAPKVDGLCDAAIADAKAELPRLEEA